MFKKLKGLVATGILVLIPVVVILAVFFELYEFNLVVVNLLDALAPNNTFFDVATANFLAILMILLLCVIAGAAVRIPIVSEQFDRLEQILLQNIPGYAMLRSSYSSRLSGEDVDRFIPVVVFSGREYQIGFEIESSNSGLVVVYFPNSPNPNIGKICAVPQSTIQRLDIGTKATMEIFEFSGKGFLEGIEGRELSGE